jgi:hypothetical protein
MPRQVAQQPFARTQRGRPLLAVALSGLRVLARQQAGHHAAAEARHPLRRQEAFRVEHVRHFGHRLALRPQFLDASTQTRVVGQLR